MWAAWIVAAITVGAVAFMLRFLMALLRERAPSVCYWVVPVRNGLRRRVLETLSANYVEDGCGAPECNHSEYVELSENENYAKAESSSGLIALDVRPASDGLGWRSIYPRRSSVFREHRL
jgi:hypothetical protein